MADPQTVPGRQARINFTNPQLSNLGRHIRYAAGLGLPMVERDRHADRPGGIVCGLGHSIKDPDVIRRVKRHQKNGWVIFAMKEGLTYLKANGIFVDYSVTMDPGPHQATRTQVYPDVTYCIASTCHPDLFDVVRAGGGAIEIFHSASGYKEAHAQAGYVIDLGNGAVSPYFGNFTTETAEGDSACPIVIGELDELNVYAKAGFANTDTMCGGFTVANRALALAAYMGLPKLVMAGCDFGWRGEQSDGDARYYADFVKSKPIDQVFMSDHGKVDGRPWMSRPDMVASAQDIARRIKSGQVEVWGDSLAVSLSKFSDEKLESVCKINT